MHAILGFLYHCFRSHTSHLHYDWLLMERLGIHFTFFFHLDPSSFGHIHIPQKYYWSKWPKYFMETYFSETLPKFLQAPFPEKANPFLFHFSLVVRGITFSDWGCDYYFYFSS